jgi:hypothetical protein
VSEAMTRRAIYARPYSVALGGKGAEVKGAGGAGSGVSDKTKSFEAYYRAAMVDAHGDDLDTLRRPAGKGPGAAAAAADRTDVGIIMRAIQAGGLLIPHTRRR